MKDYRISAKAYANTYYELLKKGNVPRNEIKRTFYDQGKLQFEESTLDTIWTAFMDGTYNPSSKSLGGKKNKTKEKKQIMQEKPKTKRGPKPRKIQFMDRDFVKVHKTFDTIEEAAQQFRVELSEIKKILSMSEEKKIKLWPTKPTGILLLRYEPKETTPKQNEGKKIEVTIPKKVKKDDFLDSTILINAKFGSEDVLKEFNELYPEESKVDEGQENNAVTTSYRTKLLNKLDDARTAYIEALKDYAVCAISQFGIDLEEKDIHLVAYLDEEFK